MSQSNIANTIMKTSICLFIHSTCHKNCQYNIVVKHSKILLIIFKDEEMYLSYFWKQNQEGALLRNQEQFWNVTAGESQCT